MGGGSLSREGCRVLKTSPRLPGAETGPEMASGSPRVGAGAKCNRLRFGPAPRRAPPRPPYDRPGAKCERFGGGPLAGGSMRALTLGPSVESSVGPRNLRGLPPLRIVRTPFPLSCSSPVRPPSAKVLLRSLSDRLPTSGHLLATGSAHASCGCPSLSRER